MKHALTVVLTALTLACTALVPSAFAGGSGGGYPCGELCSTDGVIVAPRSPGIYRRYKQLFTVERQICQAERDYGPAYNPAIDSEWFQRLKLRLDKILIRRNLNPSPSEYEFRVLDFKRRDGKIVSNHPICGNG